MKLGVSGYAKNAWREENACTGQVNSSVNNNHEVKLQQIASIRSSRLRPKTSALLSPTTKHSENLTNDDRSSHIQLLSSLNQNSNRQKSSLKSSRREFYRFSKNIGSGTEFI